MKLNIGSGGDLRPGWLNVDVRPVSAECDGFLCCDLAELHLKIPDSSVDEIALRNVLEYLPWREADAVLVMLAGKLRPDGCLYLRVPDIDAMLSTHPTDSYSADELDRRLLGDQVHEYDVRRSLWSRDRVLRRLRMVGFGIDRIESKDEYLEAWGKRLSESPPVAPPPWPGTGRSNGCDFRSRRETLDELAIRHGSDKSSRVHGYAECYDRFFSRKRDDIVRLLEIGVGDGGSLRMWREYFPNSEIMGLNEPVGPIREVDGAKIFNGVQTDREVLNQIRNSVSDLDIVVDNGTHRWSDQIATFEYLFPTLRSGGWYVIEDLHASYWERFRAGNTSTVEFLQRLVDDLNLRGKSGYGEVNNDPQKETIAAGLSPLERSLKQIVFAKSLVLIQRR
jgi:hypothetical protein